MLDDDLGTELVRRFGSPLYAHDLDEVETRARTLMGVLPAGSQLYFSLKANPLPAIAEVLCAAACGAEVSSPGELSAAVGAGFAPRRILYTGPGKSGEELRAAVAAGVGCFSCESFTELGRLAEQAEASGSRPRVLLRVNPAEAPAAGLAMSGVASQFGFEEAELAGRARELRALAEVLDVAGVHVYFGTQVAGVEALLANVGSAIAAAERVGEQLGIASRILNVGGGFPWPFAVAGEGPDLSPLRAGLRALSRQRQRTLSAELWFESGRYLCAAAGSLVARIVDVKQSKQGKKYVILDAGINHLGGMSGLGRILRPRVSARIIGKPPAAAGRPPAAAGKADAAAEKPPAAAGQADAAAGQADAAAGKLPAAPAELYDLVGPLCSPLDTLAADICLGDPRAGDLLHIPNVGAYGLTASLVHFLSREPPLEVSYRGNQCTGVHRLRHGHERYQETRSEQWQSSTTTT